MYNFSAHHFSGVYQDLDINLSKLSCVMLSVRKFACPKLDESILYKSKNKNRSWIDGQVANKNPHVTLLYGIMPQIKKKHVDAVLKGWKKKSVEIDGIAVFDSPYDDDQYYCIVAEVNPFSDGDDCSLEEANERLKMLPHVNTFPGYRPHVTLAYIKKDDKALESALEILDKALVGKRLRASQIDYGDEISD